MELTWVLLSKKMVFFNCLLHRENSIKKRAEVARLFLITLGSSHTVQPILNFLFKLEAYFTVSHSLFIESMCICSIQTRSQSY
jgi:hypothetical protein